MARRSFDKKPLYRRVNRCTHGLWHRGGGEHRWSRNTKAETQEIAAGATTRGMGKRRLHGLDYTPLYRFLLSKVGADWDAVHAEALSRLPADTEWEDRDAPIFRMVARSPEERRAVVSVDEFTLFSGLYVDADNRLAVVAPEVRVEHIHPYCPCHTHTFNGRAVTNPCRNPRFTGGEGKWTGYLGAGPGDA